MKKLFALLLVATHAFAGLPPTTIQGQNDTIAKTKFAFQVPNNQATDLGGIKALIETGSDDVLANPTFQATGVSSSVVPSWTLAGAGVTAGVSTNPTFGNDPQVLSLTLSGATGDLLSQDVTPKSTASFAGINLENSLWVYAPTSGVTLQVCARLSAADVSGACVSVPNIGGWVYVPSAGSVGGSGSAGVSLFASASSTGTVYVTHGYVGRNRNLSNATPITAWSTGLSLTPNGFGTVTSQVYETRQVGDSLEVRGYFTTGTAAGTTASISLPSGYTIDSNKLGSGTNGTMLGLITRQTSGTNSNFSGNLSAYIFYDGSTTDRVFISNQASGLAFVKATGSGYAGSSEPQTFDFKVPVTQFASSVPIASLANVAASYSGTLAGSGGGWGGVTGTGPGWNDFSVATTSTTLSAIQALNITCSAEATKLPAVTCSLPYAGLWSVCATTPLSNSVQGGATFGVMTDGSNNILGGGVAMVAASAGAYASQKVCGDYSYSGSGSVTFKVRGQVNGNTGTVAQLAAAPIFWEIFPSTQQRPQPYATGNVSTSSTTGQEHIERVFFAGNAAGTANCSSTPCTIVGQSSSWVTSVSRSSTGIYVVNIASGEFSTTPFCWCNSDNALAGSQCQYTYSLSSLTTANIVLKSTAGALNDGGAEVYCMGPH